MLRAHIISVILVFFMAGHGIAQETTPPPPDAKSVEVQRVALEKIEKTLENPQKADLPALLQATKLQPVYTTNTVAPKYPGPDPS